MSAPVSDYLARPLRTLPRALFETRRRTWMGGSAPQPYHAVDVVERYLIGYFYQEQCDTWEDYWHEPIACAPVDVRNTFWGRARYDAHATFRDFQRSV